MTYLREDILAVEVPTKAKDFEFDKSDNSLYYKTGVKTNYANEGTLCFSVLPPGNWQFLFTSDDAKDIYIVELGFCSREEFEQYLQSKGLKGNCAILKKQL